jgi:methanogenic corrinoid protein MtbC1
MRITEGDMGEEILNKLEDAVRAYDEAACTALAEESIKAGVDPIKAANILTKIMEDVGDAFTRGGIFLPELIGAGSAMKAAMSPLNAEIAKKGLHRKSIGIAVIGTVFGDIHSIGKDMVSTLLTATGFTVHDLGIDVKAEQFIAAIKKRDADILAMSALLTTTAKEQQVVIEALKQEGLREKVKVMVGGGAIDESFANSIGADGYAATAPEAGVLAKGLIEES